MRSGYAVLIGVVAACTRTFHGEAVQPNPVANPTETLRSSERIQIIVGDMELNMPEQASGWSSSSPAHNRHYPLINAASFTVVTRDRLRFHVQVDHKWEEYADLNTWHAVLVDDRGRVWTPEALEHARVSLITKMWDREQKRAVCDSHGKLGNGNCVNTVGHDETSGWQSRQTLGNLSVFRGRADFVFYDRELFTPNMKWLKLTISRSGEVFEFVWHFEDEVASAE
jgi:hypothetical protein